MIGRWIPILAAVTLVAGAVAWALLGLPGTLAGCLPADCDCETAGPGPIRQPANAWSSLAIAAAGIAALLASLAGAGEARGGGAAERRGRPTDAEAGEAGSGPRRVGGRRAPTRPTAAGALVFAGLAAFLYHSGLTAWAARLDGIAVAVLIGALALHGWERSHGLPRGGGGGARAKGPSGEGGPDPGGARAKGPTAKGRSRGGSPTGAMRRASLRRAVAPWCLLALGGLCWGLGRSGGPWCRPDSLLQAHAAWHLLAPGAIGLWLRRGSPIASPTVGEAREPRGLER